MKFTNGSGNWVCLNKWERLKKGKNTESVCFREGGGQVEGGEGGDFTRTESNGSIHQADKLGFV